MYTSTETLYAHFLTHPQVCTDTRNVIPQGIFFALKGGNFNGNAFAGEALNKGAAFAVVDEAQAVINDHCLLVPDVLTALQDLARHHRRTLGTPIVALTGSNGKTTTKELLARVLMQKFNTHFTQGNFNNHIGVPLTLLAMKHEHEMAVIEMGANHQQEIAQLCAIAEPDFGMITNVGLAHLEGFGGPEGVLKGKTEMYDALRAKAGIVFVWADDARLLVRSEGMKRMLYGTVAGVDVRGELIEASPFVRFVWETKQERHEVFTEMVGGYNFPNLLAAATIGTFFGIEANAISKALALYVPANSRSQLMKKNSNTILLDAYNANPSSMKAALENFARMDGAKKLVVLGDMFELGDRSAAEHQAIVDLLSALGLHGVVLAGKYFSATSDTFGAVRVLDGAGAGDWLRAHAPQDTLILIKGSRGMKLEGVLEVL